MDKGQSVRLFLSNDNTNNPVKVIGAARSLQFHISCTVEECSTKDTDSNWVRNEVTAVNFDITTDALVSSGETITSAVGAQGLSDLESIYEAGTPVKFKIASVSGDNNRTAGNTIFSGSVIISNLSISATNRQLATYNAQLIGVGDFT